MAAKKSTPKPAARKPAGKSKLVAQLVPANSELARELAARKRMREAMKERGAARIEKAAAEATLEAARAKAAAAKAKAATPKAKPAPKKRGSK